MEKAPENGKESSNSAHANGMNERGKSSQKLSFRYLVFNFSQNFWEGL
jgi:hypothetical protein